MDCKQMLAQLNPERMPKHVAIIMDGNGRWARKHGVKRLMGHNKGVSAVRELIEVCVEAGIQYVTIYAFSTENWRRSKIEVHGLLQLIMDSLIKNIAELHKQNIVVRFLGSRDRLSKNYKDKIDKICSASWNNTGLRFNIAMNYGGRRELLDAFDAIRADIADGKLPDEPLTDEVVGQYLYTNDIPDPDLIIRTSGEQRLSNFLLWQSAYAELWFTDVLWPDFRREHLLEAVLDYQSRQRKFGVETK
ncbi:MAG: isoprenyl transferase [Candidatus Cloacimonetes bacterium]|nr:isoprenyl transferase [Candidatus Cloacimonadota bacterium]